MLPNHAPLVVAEQFALLEAAHPGRIDLGIGRAPGTDPVTSFALRHGAGGVSDDAVNRFPEYVDNVLAMMDTAGRRPRSAGRHATSSGPRPHARRRAARSGCSGPRTTPPGWPRRRGLPYVFAHHFSGAGTAEALELYRSQFRPSPELAEPPTFLTVNAVRRGDARRRPSGWRCPSCSSMVALRTGAPAARRSRWSRRPRRSTLPDAHREPGLGDAAHAG